MKPASETRHPVIIQEHLYACIVLHTVRFLYRELQMTERQIAYIMQINRHLSAIRTRGWEVGKNRIESNRKLLRLRSQEENIPSLLLDVNIDKIQQQDLSFLQGRGCIMDSADADNQNS